MKLSCLQENFSRGLAVVGRAVATRTTLPITQNVLISTDQSRLKLTATNLEIAISTWIGADIEEEGSITLPARLLTEFVNSLPTEQVNITSSDQSKGLAISCARVDAHINGTPADDFPPIPTVESGTTVKIESKVLKEAISYVAFAAATEESRPVLTGLKIEISDNDFTFAAADGFRLAVYKGNLVEPVSENLDFIVPARTLQEVSRLIGSQAGVVEFMVTQAKSQVLFRLDNVEIVSQLVQGLFPNYSQLIPQTFDTRAVVELDEFLRATRTASIFTRDGSGIIRLQAKNDPSSSAGQLSLSARAEDLGDNEGEIDAEVEGVDAKIAFNSRYLAEVLDVLGKGKIALEVTTPSNPGVLRPVDIEGYVHVVMPMFVQW